MMVAAHNDDLVAARAQGFRTAFVARPHEHGPGADQGPRRRPMSSTSSPSDFGDLADQLGC